MKNKKSNFKQIIPLAIGLLLLTISYAFASADRGEESLTTSIEEALLPESAEANAEDDEAVCGLKEVVCPFEAKKTYTAWATKFSRADSCHTYTCHDRYAQWVQDRQGDTFDIFTENYNEAKNFGKQKLKITVL